MNKSPENKNQNITDSPDSSVGGQSQERWDSSQILVFAFASLCAHTVGFEGPRTPRPPLYKTAIVIASPPLPLLFSLRAKRENARAVMPPLLRLS